MLSTTKCWALTAPLVLSVNSDVTDMLLVYLSFAAWRMPDTDGQNDCMDCVDMSGTMTCCIRTGSGTNIRKDNASNQ